MPEAATGRGVSDAGSSETRLQHLDGLELMRQLWETQACRAAPTKSPDGDEAVPLPAGTTRPGTKVEDGGGGVHPGPFTREDLERLMMALARSWSVEA